jgi:hypothetical protein
LAREEAEHVIGAVLKIFDATDSDAVVLKA